ncbi:MAG: VOC family protein [Candidatus Dormibacteraceae bacterium]
MLDNTVQPIPEGFHTLTPTLVVRGAARAIDFYKQAFGAVELSRAPSPDGQLIWNATLQIGDSRFMLCDEMPDGGCLGPQSVGGSSAGIHIYVEDADTVYQRAIDAGATVIMAIENMFWGDRYGTIRDPFGHTWSIATHIENPSKEEMERRTKGFATASNN